MEFSVQLAAKNNIDEILALYKEFFLEMAAHQPKLLRPAEANKTFIKSMLNRFDTDYFVALADGKTVGFVLVQQLDTPDYACNIPYKYAYLMDIKVSKLYQGNGIGAKLIERVEQWAKDRGLAYVELNVLAENKGAQKLYKRTGYKPNSIKMHHIIK